MSDKMTKGAIHSTKISGNFGPNLNGSVTSNRKSFDETGPPFEVVLFSRSDRVEFWLNRSRPKTISSCFIVNLKSTMSVVGGNRRQIPVIKQQDTSNALFYNLCLLLFRKQQEKEVNKSIKTRSNI